MPIYSQYKNLQGKEVDLEVMVYTRPNLRGSLDEMLMYQGRNNLDNLFEGLKIDKSKKRLYFEYPERWLNILEQRALLDRIFILYPNIEKVVIKTHSVYIIQCTYKEHIRIYDDPTKYPEQNYKDLSIRYSPLPSEIKGLTVFNG